MEDIARCVFFGLPFSCVLTSISDEELFRKFSEYPEVKICNAIALAIPITIVGWIWQNWSQRGNRWVGTGLLLLNFASSLGNTAKSLGQ